MSSEPDDDGDDLGTRLRGEPAEVSSLLGHLYRGELGRAENWSSRLDQTTNWAVTIVAAVVTWVFSSPDNPHYILLLGIAIVVIFNVVEARRYRFYDVWRSRVRLLEEDLLAPMLDADVGREHDEWQRELSEDLRRPVLKISFLEAYDRRLRRVYLPLLLVLLVAWIVRISAFTPDTGPVAGAAIGDVPGWVVVGAVAVCSLVVLVVAAWPIEREAKGELRETEDTGEWKDE